MTQVLANKEEELKKAKQAFQHCAGKFKTISDEVFELLNTADMETINASFQVLKMYWENELNPALTHFIVLKQIYASCLTFHGNEEQYRQVMGEINTLKLLQNDYAILCIDIKLFISFKSEMMKCQ